ncbi:MAG: DUF1998 domain-containing protein, partial [Armatimonadetes bacterium]|nr:DUF1998 domain-containing protein [Armatimonadota bacterium]
IRMLLPAFMTCDTPDFSHSVGSANSPWNAVFIWERFLHGLGFTEKIYERLHEIIPATLENIRSCDCADGCPCCVGKPLRQYDTWNVERGEGHIPSKRAALMILEGLIGDGTRLDMPETGTLTSTDAAGRARLERALRRRLEVMREPQVLHPVTPEPLIETGYPDVSAPEQLHIPDVARRRRSRKDFAKEIRRRTAKNIPDDLMSPHAPGTSAPPGMRLRTSKPPTTFSGRPDVTHEREPDTAEPGRPQADDDTIVMGDALASRARRLKRRREKSD